MYLKFVVVANQEVFPIYGNIEAPQSRAIKQIEKQAIQKQNKAHQKIVLNIIIAKINSTLMIQADKITQLLFLHKHIRLRYIQPTVLSTISSNEQLALTC